MEHLLLGGGILILFVALIIFLGSVFWIWMLVDALLSKTLSDNEKAIWGIVIFFTHFIGALVYYFAGRRMRVL